MKTMLQLLFIQLLFAALLSALIAMFHLNAFSNQVEQTERQTSRLLQQLLVGTSDEDAEELGSGLRQTQALQQLVISDANGTSLFQFNSPSRDSGLTAALLNWQDWQPQSLRIQDPATGLQLRFTYNHSDLLAATNRQLQHSLALILLISLLLAPVLFWLQRFSFQRSSHQLNTLIEQLTQAPSESIPIELRPEGFAGTVEKLEQLAQSTVKKFSELSANARQVTEDAYKDTVTGLPNRNRFVQHYEEQLTQDGKVDFGIFAITRCTELQSLNQTRGYQEGDKYIQEVCAILDKLVRSYSGAQLYRLNSSDFGILLPRVTAKEAENFAVQLQSRLNQYQQTAELESVAYTGLVSYENGRALGELLAIADTSISLAQTKQANAWHLQKESAGLETASYGYGNQNWRNVIDDVLANNRISLLAQSIQPAKRTGNAYSEILVRFKTQENQVLPTASFLAMAEKLDRIIAVDRLIIETALTTIKNKNLQDQYFGLNLSNRSVHDDQFVIWLERRLLKDATIASRLIFEVTEFGMQQNLKTSKRFIDMAHRAGARVTVEKFGVGITSFKFFRELKPDHIKMDGSYTRHIDDDKNNQYFLRLMIDLAHRIGVSVFAESVETQEEKHMLDSLFMDGCQGYYIGKPNPL